MRLTRRILLTAVITLAVIFVGVQWILPAAFVFDAARKASPITRIVPVDLRDKSISAAPGKKLSYVGYEFEIPWNDLDETQTKLYPKDTPEKCKVDLRFRSELRLLVTAVPPRDFVNRLSAGFHSTPQALGSAFGRETASSDYVFFKTLYEFSPSKMNHWAPLQVLARDQFLLILKSAALQRSANSGIFNVQSQEYRGFQQGDPQVRQDGITVDLFSDEGSVEVIFLQKDYQNPAGVTQPEINRIIQSLRKAPQQQKAATQVTEN